MSVTNASRALARVRIPHDARVKIVSFLKCPCCNFRSAMIFLAAGSTCHVGAIVYNSKWQSRMFLERLYKDRKITRNNFEHFSAQVERSDLLEEVIEPDVQSLLDSFHGPDSEFMKDVKRISDLFGGGQRLDRN